MIGANLGSGQRRFTSTPEVEWVNIDVQRREPDQVPDVIADIRALPYAESHFDYVVLHHVAEHFGCGGDGVFQEARRVLKPGGSLLVFVPDIRALAERWLQGGISDFIYIVNLMGAYGGSEFDRHKWHYTKQSLAETLLNCGHWGAILAFDWRAIPGADIARDFWILGVEAIK